MCFYGTHGYFTVPGHCPDNVRLQENFRLADFYGKWYQNYHYSSDNRNLNNCSTLHLITKPDGIYLNQSRVDRRLFHRFSIGKLVIPPAIEDAADLKVKFKFENAPRRRDVIGGEKQSTLAFLADNLVTKRTYSFRVLATNYNYYAAVYTCQYSPLINKHYLYIWILSRNEILNDVSKELALRALQQLGVDAGALRKDETACAPGHYEDGAVEPTTFRYPVPI